MNPEGEKERGPFDYPLQRHRRRHTPRMQTDYRRYKPCLRDEFRFTCVYCLMREPWLGAHFYFGVEHYRAKSKGGRSRHHYSNLLYACNQCNNAKGETSFAPELHPDEFPYGRVIRLAEDGSLETSSPAHKKFILDLNLNREGLRLYRAELQEVWELAEELAARGEERAATILMKRFRWPHDMPTLEELAVLGRACRPYSGRAGRKPWF